MLATSAIIIAIIVPVSRYIYTPVRLVLWFGQLVVLRSNYRGSHKKRAGERAEARPPAEYYLVT